MAEEIVGSVSITEDGLSKLPSVWDDKPNVIGLNTSILESLQTTLDDIKEWANATCISNATGSTLDDYGYLFNILRNGRLDSEYKAAILSEMSASNDSGTASQVISLAKNMSIKTGGTTSDTVFADIKAYPDTRFGTLRLEGGILTESMQAGINKAVSSGCRLLTTWDSTGDSFIPAVYVDLATPEEILARLSSGTDPIGVRLGVGVVEDLGYAAEASITYYPAGVERSILKPNANRVTITDSSGDDIELIGSYDNLFIEVDLSGSTIGLTAAILSFTTTQ